MIVRYTQFPNRMPMLALGGALIMPRPVLSVLLTGAAGSALRDGLLDSGADETLFDPTIASQIGVDLTTAPERGVHLFGRGVIRCRYALVKLRITDGVSETYEWDAMVGFAPFPIRHNLLGFAGFLQFFDANFRGDAEEVILFPNSAFAGRII